MALAPKQQRKKFGLGELLIEPTPEPISNISGCLDTLKRAWKKKGSLAGLWNDWNRLAGEKLASNCRPLSLRRGVLIIGASHPQWRQALIYSRPQLLAALKAAGHDIKDLKIQQYHPSANPDQEDEKSIWARHPSRIDVHGITNCQSCGCPAPTGEMALWGRCSFCRRKQLY